MDGMGNGFHSFSPMNLYISIHQRYGHLIHMSIIIHRQQLELLQLSCDSEEFKGNGWMVTLPEIEQL